MSDWPTVTIGEIAKVARGGSPRPITKFITNEPDGVNWIKIGDTEKGGRYITGTAEKIIRDGIKRSRWVDEGDFLLTNSMSFGRPYILKTSGCIHDGWLVLKPDYKRIDQDFLYYVLSSPTTFAQFDAAAAGSTVRNLNIGLVEKVRIPLPPLEEQKRIVAVLDQAFAALDRARALAEANLADAEEVFPSILRGTFSNTSERWLSLVSPKNLETGLAGRSSGRSKIATKTGGRSATTRPIQGDYGLCVLKPEVAARKGWAWTPLTALARLESGHTPSRKRSEYWGGEIGWIGIKDARDHHGGVVYETRERTNSLGIENSSARVLPAGTVCLSRTASVGYVVIMGCDMATSQDFVNWICGDALSPNFLKYLLLAQGEEIRRFASGSVHQTIYFPEVKGFYICHPTREIQDEICRSLDRAYAEAKKLTAFYHEKVEDIADLRQSLLQKAFAGELT